MAGVGHRSTGRASTPGGDLAYTGSYGDAGGYAHAYAHPTPDADADCDAHPPAHGDAPVHPDLDAGDSAA
jgi:hypothetical protein